MPVSSDVDIANLALIGLGARPITSLDDAANSLDETGPDRAVIMKTLFDPTREDVLSEHPWNFAVRRAILAEVLPVPVDGFAHAFALPQGATPLRCLRVIDTDLDRTWNSLGWWGWGAWGESWGYSREGLWRIEGRTLVTDEPAIKIRYIGLVLDVTIYSPSLVEVLNLSLQVKAAGPLDRSAAVIDAKQKQLTAAIRRAKTLNGMEGSVRSARSTVLTDCR